MTRTLVECLKLFNRKERYWLIRNALGETGQELLLSKSFRQELGRATNTDIPADAWWALDYHIDWLFGALLLDSKADGTASKPIDNPDCLIRGTQEDFDFVVAFDRTIILVEAKGVTGWDTEQMSRKRGRLSEWKEFSPTVKSGSRDGYVPPRIILALTSPNSDGKTRDPRRDPAFSDEDGKKLPHVDLDLFGDPKRFLAPTRCNPKGTASSSDGLWHVTRAK